MSSSHSCPNSWISSTKSKGTSFISQIQQSLLWQTDSNDIFELYSWMIWFLGLCCYWGLLGSEVLCMYRRHKNNKWHSKFDFRSSCRRWYSRTVSSRSHLIFPSLCSHFISFSAFLFWLLNVHIFFLFFLVFLIWLIVVHCVLITSKYSFLMKLMKCSRGKWIIFLCELHSCHSCHSHNFVSCVVFVDVCYSGISRTEFTTSFKLFLPISRSVSSALRWTPKLSKSHGNQ
jgi:hypothetical protein